MQKIRWILLIAAILLALTLVLQNNESVEVRLLWLGRTLPLSILLTCTTAIGFLLGALTTVLMLRRGRKSSAAKTPKPVVSEATPTDQAAAKPNESHPLR